MVNKHNKRWSLSLAIREMQCNTTNEILFHTQQDGYTQNVSNNKCDKGVEQVEGDSNTFLVGN